MSALVGNAPNQVPTNGDLGDMAYQTSDSVYITGGVVTTGYQYVVPVSAGTYAMSLRANKLILDPAATLASFTVNLPSNPIDGLTARICTSNTITALSVAAGVGTTHTVKTATTTLAAGGFVEYTYVAANTSWYRSAF